MNPITVWVMVAITRSLVLVVHVWHVHIEPNFCLNPSYLSTSFSTMGATFVVFSQLPKIYYSDLRCLCMPFICMCYIADASKTGVAQETLQNAARRGSKALTEQEARQILGVSEQTTWEEILKVSISSFLHFSFYIMNRL